MLAMLAMLGTPATAQRGPAQVAYAWANEASTASYTPNASYAYNPAGGGITITRNTTGSYSVVFSGLGARTDAMLGGLGNVQVSAYGTNSAICKPATWSASGDYTVSVLCYNQNGLLSDNRFTIMVTLPGSNPIDMGFAFANQLTTPNYTADKSRAYNSEARDVTITRSSTGNYQVRFVGMGNALDASGAGEGGHVQVTGVGTNNGNCTVPGWTSSSGDLVVSVYCFTSIGTMDMQFSILVLGKNSDVGGLGFAWANSATTSSYSPNATYSHNAAGAAATATRTSTGQYAVQWSSLSTFSDGSPGGFGHVHVVPYSSGSQAFCTVGGWSYITGTANVSCFEGYGGSHVPLDTRFNVFMLFRQTTSTDTGGIDFDAFADEQVITGVTGEPVTFPDGLEIGACSSSNFTCARAWSGNKIAYGQIGFEFDREPIVVEFTMPQSSVTANVNASSMDGNARSATLTAKRADGSIIGTDVRAFDAAPSWGTRLEFTQPPGLPEITRVEITSASVVEWIYIDDLWYDDAVTLPVELSQFTAVADESGAVFEWATKSESDLAGFYVERAGASSWTAISDFIPARAPSGTTYTWSVRDLLPGSALFRLSAVDVDGSTMYSDVLELTLEVQAELVAATAYPNPVVDRATVHITTRVTQELRVGLFDVLGRRVAFLGKFHLEAGTGTYVKLDATQLPAGTYLVRVIGDRAGIASSAVVIR